MVANPGASVDFTAMRPPYQAGLARGPGGRSLVVFSSNDAVFSADVTGIARDPDGGAPGTVEFRIVPVTRVPIRSLAVVDVVPLQDGGVPYAHVWALARDEVVEVSAMNEAQWRARPVPVPAGPVTELWADGEYARIGYADGRVVSLPAQKPLADALEAGSQPVIDYLQFRGQAWAVARDGLWRLNAPPESAPVGPGEDARGAWVKGPAIDAPGFAGAKLFEADGALYLFTSVGWVYRIE